MNDDGWFAGFVDGEGCFMIQKHIKRGRSYWYPEFTIKVRDDDFALLRQCQRAFGGKLYAVDYTERPYARQGDKPQAQWMVRARSDVLRLVDYFQAFPLRSRKVRDYRIWRSAVLYLVSGEGTTRDAWLVQIKDQLQENRRYSQHG
jgi:hypothetical protein